MHLRAGLLQDRAVSISLAMFLALVLALSMIFAAPVFAAPSKLIAVQGRLTSPGTGNPYNGQFSMTFRLFAAATGGTAVFEETNTAVQVTDGLWNEVLGDGGQALPVFDKDYFLEVTISGETLAPRQRLVASPYAISPVELIDASISAAKLIDGAVTAAKIVDGAVTGAKIVDLAIGTAKIADAAVITAKLADGAVSAAKLADGAVTVAKILDGAITSAKIATGDFSFAGNLIIPNNKFYQAKKADGTVVSLVGINAADVTNIFGVANIIMKIGATTIANFSSTGLNVTGTVQANDFRPEAGGKLWGPGRPGTGFTSRCTISGIEMGESKHTTQWWTAAEVCPAGMWVCTVAERTNNACGTNNFGTVWLADAGNNQANGKISTGNAANSISEATSTNQFKALCCKLV